MRLIRRSVGIDDEVQAGPVDLQAAQANAGTEEIAQAENHAQALDFCVGRFAGIFKTVNHDSVGFGFKMEQAPVERCNLGPAAGEFFERRDEALAHHVFKCRRAGHEIEADGQNRQKDRRCSQRRAEDGAGRSGADGCARLRCGRGGGEGSSPAMGLSSCSLIGSPLPRRSGWLAFALPAHGLRGRLREQAPGSSTSTSPCWRRLVSQLSNRWLTCCCSRIS